MELDWNHEPGDVLICDEGEFLIVSPKGFEGHFAEPTEVDYMLVNRNTGELEACFPAEDLEELWRYYSIRNIIKRKGNAS